jgi:hypothetical protein
VGPDADPGSFRDPLSSVFIGPDAVFRGLTAEGLREYEAVERSSFFPTLLDEGLVVATERLVPDDSPLEPGWDGTLRHERIPVITYPYEWTFAMLRDAALLQLEVTQRALAEGFTTKDATSYNVQFRGVVPVFIDVGSFEQLRRGEPWPGYRQFCDLFLNPLVVQSVGGVPFQPLLRGAIDGISPPVTAAMIRGRRRFNRKLFVHVRLQARAEARFSDSTHDVRAELRQAGFGPKVIAAQLTNVRRLVEQLEWDSGSSTWSDYSDRSHYSDVDLAAKESFVVDAVRAASPQLVLDLGANDGRFSSLAVDNGATSAVAVDSDHLVVDRLYRHLREIGEQRILPLVLDLADPSPSLGWRSRERTSFTNRVRPDLVLALAVVHHLALTNTVPFREIVSFLHDFGSPLVVEFPHRDDPMVGRLLARKRAGLFDHYDQPEWDKALQEHFDVREQEILPSGRRTLYRCTPR